jgi:2-polyprenyl-6-methoxyphenol hydroxylase-like FAD-dependent oxidoreductase
MYDAIIVGARVAGSSTALLLARKGYRVLLVDRAAFPSDTLSTHQLQIPGSAALKRWGLLDKVLATEPGTASQARFDIGEIVLTGQYPTVDGINAIHSPRRYLLDTILIEAAAQAGVEVRQECTLQELLWEQDRVIGIRGQSKAGGSLTEHARMIIGADGRHSLVAKAVNAPVYDEQPTLTCGYYSYWEDVPLQTGEIYRRGKRMIGLWPTNNHQTLIYVAWPAAEFATFRADVEGNFMATIDLVPALAERVRQGRRAERISGSGEMPNFYRKPYGPGWALVGDAGYMKDPITAFGITDAFRDAELLATALDDGFAGRQPPETALAHYEQQRNATSKPYYDFTLDTARMNPWAVEQLELMSALRHNTEARNQFFAMLTCVVSPTDFFTPQNIFRIIGMRGMTKILVSKLVHPPKKRISA